jgi:hypothetical protein
MFWQAFYAVAGCVIGAAALGNYGALIGTIIGRIITIISFYTLSNFKALGWVFELLILIIHWSVN